MHRSWPSFLLFAFVSACGGDDEKSGGGSARCADDCDVPSAKTELLAFLDAGMHRGFASESGPHESAGPHFGMVRTYVSPKLEASLAGGTTAHPAGAAAVKELYGQSGTEARGYSVWLKSSSGESDGQDIYWYEDFDGSEFADGLGEQVCVGCHSQSERGFFQSSYPLQ